MVTIKNTGERQYQGLDSGQKPARLVIIKPGAAREVSEAHAEGVLKTWPKRFERVGGAASARKGGAS